MEENGTFDLLPKKEVSKLLGEREKLEKVLGRYQGHEKTARALYLS